MDYFINPNEEQNDEKNDTIEGSESVDEVITPDMIENAAINENLNEELNKEFGGEFADENVSQAKEESIENLKEEGTSLKDLQDEAHTDVEVKEVLEEKNGSEEETEETATAIKPSAVNEEAALETSKEQVLHDTEKTEEFGTENESVKDVKKNPDEAIIIVKEKPILKNR